jgi:hypothetical protein
MSEAVIAGAAARLPAGTLPKCQFEPRQTDK